MAKKHSKRYQQSLEKVPADPVPLPDAVRIVKSFPAPKFDPTVDLVMHLGIDPRQADQALRGSLSLPHGLGKTRSVVAFCTEDQVEAAKAAGAVEAGADELVEKIQGGWMDFDVAIASPAMMKTVSRLGRVLGPSGKMPSPKAGTVVDDVPAAVKEFAAGKVEYRNDDGGNLHVPIGKSSFEENQLLDNANAFLEHIRKRRPSSIRGTYIRKICLATTMSPSVHVAVG
jgi:large subunit ribosomal protein L1